MMNPTEARKARIRSKISGNVEAAKQFLVVAIGLGLTNSIVEKLKYGIGTNTDPGADPFFHFPSFVLFVFGVYALRFFFNNYLYIHQSYDEYRLGELEAQQRELTPLISSSYRDLFLSVFTGVMMSIISMTLADEGRRLNCLLIFLIIHYLVDAIVLGLNVFTRRKEPGYDREFDRVFCWLISNIIFAGIFLAFIFADMAGIPGVTESKLFQWTMVVWLANSIINLLVTYIFRDRHPLSAATAAEPASDQAAESA